MKVFDLVLDGQNDKGQKGLYLIGSETSEELALKRLADLRKAQLPGETYLCVTWRDAADKKRARCYGPDPLTCNCGGIMKVVGGSDSTLKTVWCPECGTEKVLIATKLEFVGD